MNDEAFSQIADTHLVAIDEAVTTFEKRRLAGEPLSIEEHVAAVSIPAEARPFLLRELIASEMRLSQKGDEASANVEYLQRFPEVAGLLDELVLPQRDTQTASLAAAQTKRSLRSNSDPSLRLPYEMGRYRLLRLLGRGGMGTVYLALDKELDRQVAIKFPEFDDRPEVRDVAIERFRREARAMATLHHPHLCPVYDVGEHEGRCFLTMAYIEGQNLAKATLSQGEAIRVVSIIARALDAAHQAGVVHRDMKPSNVMLTPEGDPIIMDFGLASRDALLESDITHTGQVIGSPAYMAPEQVSADRDRIGPRTDVYALGVILYELLTGRRPFEGSGLSALGQISAGVKPVRPSQIARVDRGLDAVCRKAMAYDPAKRYRSATDLAVALDAVTEKPDRGGLRRMVGGGVAALTLVLLAAVVVLRMTTPFGEVVVTAAEGTDLEIDVKKDGQVIAVLSPENHWRVQIKAGAYAIKARSSDRSLKLSSDTVVVSKDNQVEVTIVTRDKALPEPVRQLPHERSSLLPALAKPTKHSSGRFVNSGQAFEDSNGGDDAVTGDLDKDGDWDVVVVNKSPDHPSQIWLNDGNGILKRTQDFALNAPSSWIALGDLDADGDLDAWIANQSQKIASSVWLNDGNGTFEETAESIGPYNITCVRLGDIDGDGDLDAFASCLGANRVWFNNGQGRFVDSGQQLGNSDSRDVHLADLDNDGYLDALVVNFRGSSKVWINDRHGTFIESGQQLGDETSLGVSASLSDIDQDGDLDAFLVYEGQVSRIWSNDGAGRFTENLNEYLRPLRWFRIIGADLNGDGNDDFVANEVSQSPRPIQILLSRENGFENTWLGSQTTGATAIADFDGDGDLDIFLVDRNGVEPNQLWLNANETASEKTKAFVDSGQSLGNTFATRVVLADLDDDQDQDAFVANYNAPDEVWWNDGKGAFTDSGQRLAKSRSVGIAFGDLDSDSDLDVFVPNTGGQPNRVYLNEGGGIFRVSSQSLGRSGSKAAALRDFDGDGDLDALVVNHSPGLANRLYLNDGQASFTDSGQTLGSSNSYDLAVGDFDSDGDDDIYVANRRDEPNRVYLNDGRGIFQDSGQLLGSSGSFGATAGDVDGDGDLDVVVANDRFNRVWLNDGHAAFTDSGQLFDDQESWSVALGDVDHDGDLDAFVSNHGINSLWRNDGHGVFGNPEWYGGNRTHHAALADLDGDQDLDIFVVNEDAPNRVLLNTYRQSDPQLP